MRSHEYYRLKDDHCSCIDSFYGSILIASQGQSFLKQRTVLELFYKCFYRSCNPPANTHISGMANSVCSKLPDFTSSYIPLLDCGLTARDDPRSVFKIQNMPPKLRVSIFLNYTEIVFTSKYVWDTKYVRTYSVYAGRHVILHTVTYRKKRFFSAEPILYRSRRYCRVFTTCQ